MVSSVGYTLLYSIFRSQRVYSMISTDRERALYEIPSLFVCLIIVWC